MKPTHVPINRILLALLFVISMGLILFTYLYAFQHNPPIELLNVPFPTDKSKYSVGDNIVITTEYCRYTDVSYTLNLDFVDGLRFSTPEQRRAGASPGCGKVDVKIVTVPDNLPPGTYYLKGKNEYQVNFVANRVVEWTSQSFEVIP
jgi:hypothetical protein